MSRVLSGPPTYVFFTKTTQQNSVSNLLKEKSCLKLVNSLQFFPFVVVMTWSKQDPSWVAHPCMPKENSLYLSTPQRQTKLERERSFITLEIQGTQINQGFRKAQQKRPGTQWLLSSPVTPVLWLSCSHTAFSPESTFSTIAHAKEGVTKPAAEGKVGYPALAG